MIWTGNYVPNSGVCTVVLAASVSGLYLAESMAARGECLLVSFAASTPAWFPLSAKNQSSLEQCSRGRAHGPDTILFNFFISVRAL